MTYCTKCKIEIEDGKTLCRKCEKKQSEEGELYLDQLLNSLSESPEINEESIFDDDEINEELIFDEDEINGQMENGEDTEELLDLLNEFYDEEKELELEPAMGMDDVFEDALSAVSYVENEELEERTKDAELVMEELVLDEFALEEPLIDEFALEEPSMDELALEEPSMEEFALEEPSMEEFALEEPSMDEFALEEPLMDEFALEEPAMDEFALEEPIMEGIEIEEPQLASEEPGINDIEDIFSGELNDLMESSFAENNNGAESESEENDENKLILDDLPADLLGEQDWEENLPIEETQELQHTEELIDEEPSKLSFFKKMKQKYFSNIVDDTTMKAEEEEERLEEENIAKKEKEKEEAKKAKEEKKIKREEENEKKKLNKEAKATEAEKKKQDKIAKKQLENEEAQKQYVGRVNPVGAAIVFLFFILIGGCTYFGSQIISLKSHTNHATTYYNESDYVQAYKELAGLKLSDSDQVFYEKAKILASIQQKIDAYDQYIHMKRPLQALNSLVNAVRKYDKTIEQADKLEIKNDADTVLEQISKKLKEEFNMSIEEARRINQSSTPKEYTDKLMNIVEANSDYSS